MKQFRLTFPERRHADGSPKQRRGFTLIEILTVISIFSIVILIATNIFLVGSRFQRKAGNALKVQSDIRFAVEAISREVRFGTIDYACYDNINDCDPWGGPVDLGGVGVFGKTDILALEDADGVRIRYRVNPSDQRLYVCSILATEGDNHCDNVANWDAVTSTDGKIVKGVFYLYPFTSPYQSGISTPLQYPVSQQPRVTMLFSNQQSLNEVSPERAIVQTTAVSRLYLR